jgi:hypothetical protein
MSRDRMTFNFRLENCRCSRLFNLPAESCTKHVRHRRGFQNSGHRRSHVCIPRARIEECPALQAINLDCLFNSAHRSGQFLRCRPVSVNRVGLASCLLPQAVQYQLPLASNAVPVFALLPPRRAGRSELYAARSKPVPDRRSLRGQLSAWHR